MTLTEFLLARIAEREALAQPMAELQAMDLRTDEEIANPEPDDGVVRYGDVFTAAFELAECEAQRWIVDFAVQAGDLYEVTASGEAFVEWRSFNYALKALALPYSDHPDYNPEWLLVEER